MAPSTEHIDALLEWRPGAPQAARPGPAGAFLQGARRACSAKLLIVCLWFLHLLFVEGVGTALLRALGAETTLAGAYRSLIDTFSNTSPFAARAADSTSLLVDAAIRPLWEPSMYFVVLYSLLAGGIIAYLHAPRTAPLLPQIGAGCGTYLGRFARLLALAAVASWALHSLIGSGLRPTLAGGASLGPRMLVGQAALALTATTLDYARVRTVARDSRSMLLEVARSARFFARNLPRTLALEAALTVLGVIIGAGAWATAEGLRRLVSPDLSLLITEQLWVIALIWARLAGWAAMLSLYQGITVQTLARRRA